MPDTDEILRMIADRRMTAADGYRAIQDLRRRGEFFCFCSAWIAADPRPDTRVEETVLWVGREERIREHLQPHCAGEVLSARDAAACAPLLDRAAGAGARLCIVHGDAGEQPEANLYSLTALIQALVERRMVDSTRLLAVHPETPAHAALQGFAQAVRRELPRLVFKTVTVGGPPPWGAILSEAAAEGEPDVAYRAGVRWARRLEEVSLEPQLPPEACLKERGVYLVTGGAGGLGSIFSEHLARQYRARLVWCGRSAPDSTIAERIRLFEGWGAEVLYVQADVANAGDVRSLIAAARSHFGRIDGVLHAAGVIRDALLVNKTPHEMSAVLAPKVAGAINLDEATKDEPLDWFVLFSSSSGTLGNAGQTDYAFANSFLDHFADARSGRTLSIAWPYWADGGMRLDAAAQEQIARIWGMRPLASSAGLAAFEAALRSGLSRVMVLSGDRAKIRQSLGIGEPAAPAKAIAPPRETRGTPSWAAKLQQELFELISAILKVDVQDIDAEEDVSVYGFDSITFTQLANRINARFDLEITPAIFFEFTTVTAIVAHLLEEHREGLEKLYGAVPAESVPAVPEPPSAPRPAPLEPQPLPSARRDIAIVGMAGTMPGSEDLEQFWDHLQAGHDLITEVPPSRWDWRAVYGDPAREADKTYAKWGGFIPGVDEFDCLFFGISPREAERMDPQQRLILQAAWRAIEDAGYRASDLAGSNTGVFVGAASPDYYELLRQHHVEIDGHSSVGISFSVLANRISHFFDLRGPSAPVDTACSSSLVALHHAVEAIRNGDCDLALAGGVNVLLSPTLTIAATKAGMLSADGRCKTFDASADGYVRGEGVGLVLLKPLERAIADGDDIYAVIRASVENHGGRTGSVTTPNPTAQTELLVRAYEKAAVDPATVGYIEAHGTGTKLGDPIEINSLKSAFRQLYAKTGSKPAAPHCGLGSVKTNIGHLETAAGIAGLIKVILCLRRQWLPATLHLQEVNPYIQLEDSPLYLCREAQPWTPPRDASGRPLPRRAGISSFGFGGSNAHVVLEEHPAAQRAVEEPQPRLFVLSAKNEDRLRAYAGSLAAWLARHDVPLSAVAYTLQTGREPLEQRMAFLASTAGELAEKLAAYRDGRNDVPNLHQGHAKAARQAADALVTGRAGEAFLRILTEDRDLDRLARLWVSGVEIDFRGLYPASAPRRAHLPGYPFAKDRYWLPKTRLALPAAQTNLHPLVGRNTSTLREQSFATPLTGQEFFLTDHVIAGRKTLPGVAYLEMARAAAALAGERPVDKLVNVVWMRPLTVEDQPGEARISLRPSGDSVNFEVRTGGTNGESLLHAQGKATFGGTAGAERLDLDAIRLRCAETWTGDACYSLFDRNGFTGGPAFRAIRHLCRNRQEALAKLELPAAAGSSEAWVLHPSLMDGALETVIGLLGDTAGVPWLPFAMGELRIAGPLPRICFAHVRRSPGREDATFDIRVTDETGAVLAAIAELAFRPLETAMEQPETLFFHPVRQVREATPEPGGDIVRRVLLCGVPVETRFECEAIVAPDLDADGYRRLFEDLKRDGRWPSHIVYVAPADSTFDAVFRFVRVLQECRAGDVRLLYCYAESPAERQPHHAAFGAFARTLGAECPEISCRTVAAPDLGALERILPAELGARDDVRYDGKGGRWVEQWESLAAIPAAEAGSLLKSRGVYLVTGAAGGLGMTIARHLASAFQARLVLSGRSSEDRAMAGRIAELRAAGGDAVYIRCDVARRSDVVDLVAEAKARFGRIDGIVHCAGTVRDALIGRKTDDEIRAVLAPKVDGTKHLDEATQHEPLDFLMLFSSAAAAAGNPGQSDYAYANSFMDHFAEWRERLREQGKRNGRTISVNWPLWREGGMRVDAGTEALLRQTKGIVPLSTGDGLRVFDAVLASGLGRLMVIAGFRAKVLRLLNDAVPARRAIGPTVAHADAPASFRKDFLADVLAVLQLESSAIGLEDDLSDYGFDSLSFTELANRLNTRYDLAITPAIFFQYPTPGEAAEAIFQRHRESIQAHYSLAAPAAPAVSAEPPPFARAERFQAPAAAGIAIVGVSGVLPQSPDLETFWEHLERGDNLIRETPPSRWDWRKYAGQTTPGRWGGFLDDVDRFDCKFFGISPREAEQMDPQQRLLLETVWKLIEDAGYRASQLSGSATGVFVGVSTTDYLELLQGAEMDSHSATGIISCILPNRVSYLLNLRGPSEAIDTACSSSLVAIHRAARALENGDCDLAIAAGVNLILTPTLTLAGNKAGMLSEDGQCKTFDKSANGYVRGEGVAAILLKPLRRALADGDHIYAVIQGTAENHGGRAASLTAPNPQAQAEVLIRAYEQAGVDPASVSYIEAHGTGTALGDPIEINGLKLAFEELYRRSGRPMPAAPHCGLGSVKTNIGHLEAAAGMAGVLKVLLAMQHRRLPGLVNFNEVNPYIELNGSPFYIASEARAWEGPRVAGVSSFGFGGVNAHVVLRSHEETPRSETAAPQVIVLSARTPDALRKSCENLLNFLWKKTGQNLADFAFSLQEGREPMEARMATVVASAAELRDRLAAYLRGDALVEGLFFGSASPAAAAERVTERDLTRVAQLWVSGATVDWAALRSGAAPQRISLPTYPFAGERYWVPTPAQGYTKLLTGDEPYLRDHVIDGQRILPAVAYLELVRDAAGANLRALTNVLWSKPIVVADRPVEIRIDIEAGQFAVRSAGGEYAQGRLTDGDAAPAAGKVNVAELEARCPRVWNVDDCFAVFAAHGLRYGPSFRALRSLRTGAGEACSRLELPGAHGFAWHPSLLEGALQTVVGLVEPQPTLTYLPFSLGEMRVFAPLPERCGAHAVRAAGRAAGDARLLKFDVRIFDEEGRVLVEIADFAMRGVERSQPAGADPREAAERLLIALVAEQTKHPASSIRANEPMERYGIDSMLVISLTRELEKQFGELSKTLFFEYQTIAELAGYLAEHHQTRLVEPALPAVPLPAAAPASDEDIAIIGVSGRYPMARDLAEFWENLKAGRDCITEIPAERWDYNAYYDPEKGKKNKIYSKWGGFMADVDRFDPLFFNISPKEAELQDPQERLFLETVWHTLEDAGYSRSRLGQRRVGVYVGVMWGEYQLFGPVEALKGNLLAPGSSYASIANRVSYVFNFQGPSVALDTMCSSSLTAIHFACESLRRGESELAVAGGVNVSLHPQKYIQLSQGRFAASDGRCRSFGEGGDGYVPGEGVGAVLLKPLRRAVEDGDHIYAAIKGSSINHGGKTNGYTVPNPNAQAALIADTLRKTGVAPETISYIEAHGTGTSLGDPIEIAALTKAYGAGDGYCAIGSVKSNVGHLESAAGIAGLTKVLLQMQHGQLAPSLHSEPLNPHLRFEGTPFRVQRELSEWRPRTLPRRAGISSFGAGGSNAHLIVEEHQSRETAVEDRGPQTIVLSARTGERLRQYAGLLAGFLHEGMDLARVAYTLQVGREALASRLAFVAVSVAEAKQRLSAFAGGAAWNADGGVGFHEMAARWQAGGDVDWDALWGENRPRKIPLPGYPFARERYWLPLSDGQISSGRAPLHPLLDENVSTLTEQAFETRLTGDEFFVRDHVAEDRKILPAVAYLEMARAAAAVSCGDPVIALADVTWVRPVIVENEPLTVRVSLQPQRDCVAFEVTSGENRSVHARGRVICGSAAGVVESIDLAAIRARCGTVTEAAECYRRMERRGLRYGPGMRALRVLHSNGAEALAELRLPDTAQAHGFLLHPALMDSALQMLIAFEDPADRAAWLPFALGRAEIREALPARCFAHAQKNGSGYRIEIADEAGRVLARLADLELRPAAASTHERPIFLHAVWQASPASPESPHEDREPVLVFDFDGRLQTSLNATVVLPGTRFEARGDGMYTIRPTEIDDYRQLLAMLRNEGRFPSRIAHFWSQDAAPDLHLGVYSVFPLSKALIEQRIAGRLRLLCVYVEPAGEVRPHYRALSGFCKTLRQEQPNLDCCVVGLENRDEAAGVLAAEFAAADSDVRYRGGQRQTRSLAEVQLTENAPLLKRNGVYLITGGAGGLGLIFAEHLAQTFEARLVLSGRSELPADTADRIAHLDAIYVRADISSRDGARALVAEAKARFGSLDGVLHSAGVLRDGFVLKKSVEDVSAVLAPKVSGAEWLDEATAGEDLDFFVLFSSVAALLGNIGQADYAYANAFLDAFAEGRELLRQRGLRRGKTLAINWPLWQEGGMQAPPDVIEWAKRAYGVRPLGTAAGIRAFEMALASPLHGVAVLEGERQKIVQRLAAARAAAPPARPEPSAAAPELRERLVAYLKELVARELKLPPAEIRATEPLENYGLESVMALNLTADLESDFGTLSKTLLFEHQTVAQLADYLGASRGGAIAAKLGMPAPPAKRAEQRAAVERARFTAPPITRIRPVEGAGDIAIIGIGGRYPMAGDLDEFWRNLEAGKDCITEIPAARWDWRADERYGRWGGFMDGVDRFDPLFFNISPREAHLIDPQERLFLQTVWQTMEDAGYTRSRLGQRKIGVYVGVMWGEYQLFGLEASLNGGAPAPGATYASIANRVSYFFDFHGPSMAVDTMCSSSLTAIHLACEALRHGETEYAIAGGVNLSLHPQKYVQLTQGQFLSSDGRCRSFGEGGDGYVPGEGVGAVLLKPLRRAVEDGDRIHAVIKGSALNHGGRANGYTVPSPNAQADVIGEAFTRAGVAPSSIGYVEAHGTGTALGDPIEIAGLAKVFDADGRNGACAIGSVKSNIGHLESAAGIAGVTKVVLQMRHGQLAPSLHAGTLNAHIDFESSPFHVQRELAAWRQAPRRASVSSFGAGGANAHIVLEDYAGENPAAGSFAGPHLVVISARTEERLRVSVERLAAFLQGSGAAIEDVAYTLQVGREGMDERLAILAFTREELIGKLGRFAGAAETDGIYHGNIRAGRGLSDLLVDGEEGKAFVADLAAKGRTQKLAALWVAGVEIDWELLYAGPRPRRIALPGYPFLEERYWLREKDRRESGVTAAHPLLDGVDAGLSMAASGVVFRKRLKKTDPIVQSHRVQGNPVMPGAGYLEMALAAARETGRSERWSLADVVWLKPLAVTGEDLAVRVVLRDQGGDLAYEIQSAAGRSVVVHGKGTLRPASAPADAGLRFPIDEIRSRCGTPLDREAFYDRFRAAGLEYGPYLRGVAEIRGNEREALALVCVPETSQHELGDYALHPCVLDSALQSISGIATDWKTSHGATALSFAVDRVEILHPSPARGYAYVQAAEGGRFHVSVLDETGAVCIRLQDVAVRLLADPLASLFYTPVWRRADGLRNAPSSRNGKPKTVLIAGALEGDPIAHVLRKAHAADHFLDDPSSAQTADLVYFLGGPERGALALFHLLPSFDARRRTRLIVVTADVHRVVENDTPQADGGDLYGFAGVVAKEYPQLDVRCIDVRSSDMGETAAGELLRTLALAADWPGRDIAIRDGQIYRRGIEPAQLGPAAASPFRERGAYLIAGGSGGVGFEVSKHLARTVRARLAWIGRRAEDAEIRRQRAEVEACGGELLYVRADVTDLTSMRLAVQEVKSAFGAINGVMHSAMDVQPALLADLGEAELRSAMAAKVAGSVILHRSVADEPLDFLVYFSSAQSFTRTRGMSHYAAGSTFQDAYAGSLAPGARYPVKTVNWGYWGSVGAVAEAGMEDVRRHVASLGFGSIEPAEGLEALRRILAAPAPAQVLVFKGSSELLAAMGLERPGAIQPLPFDSAALGRLAAASRELQSFGRRLLLGTFQRMGVFHTADESHEVAPLRDRLRIAPQHAQLFAALLRILESAGYLALDGQRVMLRAADNVDGLAAEKDRLQTAYPDIASHVELLWACLDGCPRVMRGETAGTDVLFPNGGTSLVEGVYTGNASVDYFNRQVAEAVRLFLTTRAQTGRRVQLLEIGAGTGGTSAAVLPTVEKRAGGVRYVYTDKSAGLVQHGKRTYGGRYPFVEFERLDIEIDPLAQGYAAASMDVVIAANVLHATRNIRQTIRHARRLLKPGGWLIVSETTEVQELTTLTFGLLEGWWRFEDEECRLPGSPLLSQDAWTRILEEEEFRAVACLGHENWNGYRSPQHVLIAENHAAAPAMETKPRAVANGFGSHTNGHSAAAVAVMEAERRPRLEERVYAVIQAVLAEVLEIPGHAFDIETPYTDFGVDSILAVEIIEKTNQELGISLRTTDLFNYPRIASLARHIVEDFAGGIELPAAPDDDPELAVLRQLAKGEISAEDADERLLQL